MRICYVCIENFRNFRKCEVELGRNIVLVGENKSGKTNFIEALRLVLDPSLSAMDRQLTEHDFWDGDEAFKGREIKITVRFADFDDVPESETGLPLLDLIQDSISESATYLPLSLLADKCIIETKPQLIAQLTYRYYNARRPDAPDESGPDDYEPIIYAGSHFDVPFDGIHALRRNMPLLFINALRDIASDNRVWRRSPLSRLVELTDLKTKQLEPYAHEISVTSDKVVTLTPLSDLQKDIRGRLKQMVGELYTIDPHLGLTATTAPALEEALRLYVDGDKHRPLERTSLGLQNALYLALLSLEIERQLIRRTHRKEPFIPILALEEPEAHLHPHLQRLVFDDFLGSARQRKQPVLVSSHSPHLASVAEIEDIVLLKDRGNRGCVAQSAYSFIHSLDSRARKDLDRFLDITRSEMLYSKGVVFVEGDVEVLLVNQFSKIMGTPLDKYGIAVCNVSGAHFIHVVTLAYKFGVPFIVLTDGDKVRPVTGLQRGIDLIQIIRPSLYARLKSRYDEGAREAVRRYLRWAGIFVNDWTLEASLLEVGLGEELKRVFVELGEELGVIVQAGSSYVDAYLANRTEDNMKNVLKSIADTRWGKGRFAHRLIRYIQDKADSLTTQDQRNGIVPQYIRSGLEYLIAKVGSERTGM